ncbi:hypothetical protein E2542_SST06732 [Spatholobus suberectus]|nr:hypothetical protein E2542_SST06732 [Spatholobus suberectus]
MASSLSSVINQPHLAQRLKLHRPSSLTTLTIFHHKHKHKHQHNASFPHPYTSSPRSRPLNSSPLPESSLIPAVFVVTSSLKLHSLLPKLNPVLNSITHHFWENEYDNNCKF